MTTVYNLMAVKQELLNLLRSSGIMTNAERNVTQVTDSGTFTADTFLLINRTNVKDIVSIDVASVVLKPITDYTIDFDYDDSGVIKTRISFTSPQTGAYNVTYHYGSDRIHGDFPRYDLKIGSFPRISVDIIGGSTDTIALGGACYETTYNATLIVYAEDVDWLETTIGTIRQLLIVSSKAMTQCPYILLKSIGPLIPSVFGEHKIMQRNIDFDLRFIFEQA